LRALVFDFDGLILDTETAVFESWRVTWRRFGFELPRDRWMASIGTDGSSFDPVGELSERMGRPLAEEEVAERRRVRDEILLAEQAMTGIPELLAEARRGGVPLAVASSSPREWVEPHLDRLDLRDRFDTIVTRDDTERAKPFPDLYQEAVRRLGVDPRSAVAFEDSPNGVTAAKSAGLVCVAVPCDMTRDLHFGAADLMLSRVDELTLAALFERTG
jgi:HAD superfamily hydrolase (TIGR01509 family)